LVAAADGDLPDKQSEQGGDDADGRDLPAEAQPAGHRRM
jgi:hypothetical protein